MTMTTNAAVAPDQTDTVDPAQPVDLDEARARAIAAATPMPPKEGEALPPSATATSNMVALMKAQANKLIDTNLSELEEMATELSGLQVEIRQHRERIFADLDDLAGLTARTIKMRRDIAPAIAAMSAEYASAARRRPE